VDSFISGITSNPKITDSVEDINGNMTPLWKDAMPSRHVDNEPTISGAHMQPMINVDKRMVAYLYDMYGVNDLLNLTRSCEELPGDKLTASELELFKKTPCGMCWWCLERKWAFGKF
jgi:7-cyano-7-deazaguanine synthase in queuosine biosynthesis